MSVLGTYTYPAKIKENKDGKFEIRFDDLPEVNATASSLEEALKLAEDILGDAIADRIQKGRPLPSPLKKQE